MLWPMVGLAAFALAGCFAAVSPAAPPAEPLVEGKPLSHWIEVVRKADTQAPEWQTAARALKSSKEVAVPRLLPLLEEKDSRVRLSTMFLLMEMPPLSEDAVTAFVKATRDPHPGIRLGALAGLGRATVNKRRVVPVLMAALKDPSHVMRARAAASLGALGPDAAPAISALTVALGDEHQLVRSAAQEALGKIRGQ